KRLFSLNYRPRNRVKNQLNQIHTRRWNHEDIKNVLSYIEVEENRKNLFGNNNKTQVGPNCRKQRMHGAPFNLGNMASDLNYQDDPFHDQEYECREVMDNDKEEDASLQNRRKGKGKGVARESNTKSVNALPSSSNPKPATLRRFNSNQSSSSSKNCKRPDVRRVAPNLVQARSPSASSSKTDNLKNGHSCRVPRPDRSILLIRQFY
ncbi:hypothetical protein BGZ65_008102, partial [Modicella reniformis]